MNSLNKGLTTVNDNYAGLQVIVIGLKKRFELFQVNGAKNRQDKTAEETKKPKRARVGSTVTDALKKREDDL
eukprot:11690611-Ditylum_brightwellii.AAC.1